MTLKIWTAQQFKDMPWKNGGGTTKELCIHPTSGPYLWRLSIASVNQSGPFSDFSSYDRIITQLDGPPMHLTFTRDGHHQVLETLVPFPFAGEEVIECTVSGPARDFNVFVKRDAMKAEVSVKTFNGILALAAGAFQYIYVLTGRASIAMESRETPMATGSLAEISAVSSCRVHSTDDATLILISLLPR